MFWFWKWSSICRVIWIVYPLGYITLHLMLTWALSCFGFFYSWIFNYSSNCPLDFLLISFLQLQIMTCWEDHRQKEPDDNEEEKASAEARAMCDRERGAGCAAKRQKKKICSVNDLMSQICFFINYNKVSYSSLSREVLSRVLSSIWKPHMKSIKEICYLINQSPSIFNNTSRWTNSCGKRMAHCLSGWHQKCWGGVGAVVH